MNLINKKIDELIPYINNPRDNSNAVNAVASSIKNFGFKVPIVIDKNNEIITGHTRLKAAKKLGLKTVPVIIADDLTPNQAKAFRLADNKVSEFAEWDIELLNSELEELKSLNFNMDEFGFEFIENNEIQSDNLKEDNTDIEIPIDPKSKIGDIYQLGNHRLMCGDSTKKEDIQKLMNGEKADMVFTDPPYGVSYSDKNSFLNSIDKGNSIQDEIKNDNLSLYDIKTFILEAFCRIKDILNEVSSYYITAPQGGDLLMMMESMKNAGIPFRHCLIWVKNNHVLGRTDYNYKHEPILYGWVNTHKFYGNGNHKFSTWEINKPIKNDLHPTMKPIELVANAILNSSKENDAIADIFGGSGSTLIACEQTKRRCFMMEIEPKYIDVIIKRWEDFTGQKSIKIN